MAKIVEIREITGSFGFGQTSHDPHYYWSGKSDGAVYLSCLHDDKIRAIIITDSFWVYVYNAGHQFALKITSGDKDIMPVNVVNTKKTYINTVSPLALVNAAEEELRYIGMINTVSNSLARYRKAYGLTLKQLSELSGVAVNVIHRYESGERNIKTARYDTLCKLGTALQRSVEEITY